jgi:hypothetical protein
MAMSSPLFRVSTLGTGSPTVMGSRKERTVVCTWEEVKGGVRVDQDVMVKVLRDIVDPAHIEVMGTLNKNFQWHVTLRAVDAADHLCKKGEASVTSDDGVVRRVFFSQLLPKEVSLSILWVPGHVADSAIREVVKSFAGAKGRVTYCERMYVPGEGYGYYTTRFTARIQDAWPEAIPERMVLEVRGERFPILILVKGRPRACFLCDEYGHSQGECKNPICRYCKERGHVVSNCPKKLKKLQAEQQQMQSSGSQSSQGSQGGQVVVPVIVHQAASSGGTNSPAPVAPQAEGAEGGSGTPTTDPSTPDLNSETEFPAIQSANSKEPSVPGKPPPKSFSEVLAEKKKTAAENQGKMTVLASTSAGQAAASQLEPEFLSGPPPGQKFHSVQPTPASGASQSSQEFWQPTPPPPPSEPSTPPQGKKKKKKKSKKRGLSDIETEDEANMVGPAQKLKVDDQTKETEEQSPSIPKEPIQEDQMEEGEVDSDIADHMKAMEAISNTYL